MAQQTIIKGNQFSQILVLTFILIMGIMAAITLLPVLANGKEGQNDRQLIESVNYIVHANQPAEPPEVWDELPPIGIGTSPIDQPIELLSTITSAANRTTAYNGLPLAA